MKSRNWIYSEAKPLECALHRRCGACRRLIPE